MNMPQKEQSFVDVIGGIGGIIRLAIHACAATVEPYFHYRFGWRYHGRFEFGGVIVLALFSVLTTPPMEMFLFDVFFYLTAALMLLHKAAACFVRNHPGAVHSQYNGAPFLCLLGIGERTAKFFVEPLLCFITGMGLMAVHPPLGAYVCIAGVCLQIDFASYAHRREAMVHQMRDSALEMEMFDSDFDQYQF